MTPETIKQIAPIIVALAALVTASASFLRPETSARKVYDQHKADVAELAKTDEHTQREVEALREYLVKEAAQSSVPVEGSTVFVATDAGSGKHTPAPIAVLVGPRAAPPTVSSPPPPTHPPVPYESVTGKADTW